MYIHQQKNWPVFIWDKSQLAELLSHVRHLQGRLIGRIETLGFRLQDEATLQILTQDVLKTSEIENEKLNDEQVRSSIARRLGIDDGAILPTDRNVESIVEITIDATQNFRQPLTVERLFSWHAALFPTGRSGMHPVTVGGWRTDENGPMQVVSGRIGHEKVHYEAPIHTRITQEMKRFLKWFNTPTQTDLVIQSALAHFWFVTIHPFDDGNGRIARAIADMMLARSDKSPQRFYSMSAQIQRERTSYYEVLESCQKGNLDISLWIEWYLNCLKHAILASDKILQTIFIKVNFWLKHAKEKFNDRQQIMINRLLEGFEGKLNSSKWAKMTKCSQDTALRDITDLLEKKILIKENAGGRSTGYQLSSEI